MQDEWSSSYPQSFSQAIACAEKCTFLLIPIQWSVVYIKLGLQLKTKYKKFLRNWNRLIFIQNPIWNITFGYLIDTTVQYYTSGTLRFTLRGFEAYEVLRPHAISRSSVAIWAATFWPGWVGPQVKYVNILSFLEGYEALRLTRFWGPHTTSRSSSKPFGRQPPGRAEWAAS